MTLAELTTFFGWVSVINMGLLIFSTFAIMALKDMIVRMHGKMFGVQKDDILRTCYQYLGGFKIMLIFFSLTPWLALVIMAG